MESAESSDLRHHIDVVEASEETLLETLVAEKQKSALLAATIEELRREFASSRSTVDLNLKFLHKKVAAKNSKTKELQRALEIEREYAQLLEQHDSLLQAELRSVEESSGAGAPHLSSGAVAESCVTDVLSLIVNVSSVGIQTDVSALEVSSPSSSSFLADTVKQRSPVTGPASDTSPSSRAGPVAFLPASPPREAPSADILAMHREVRVLKMELEGLRSRYAHLEKLFTSRLVSMKSRETQQASDLAARQEEISHLQAMLGEELDRSRSTARLIAQRSVASQGSPPPPPPSAPFLQSNLGESACELRKKDAPAGVESSTQVPLDGCAEDCQRVPCHPDCRAALAVKDKDKQIAKLMQDLQELRRQQTLEAEAARKIIIQFTQRVAHLHDG